MLGSTRTLHDWLCRAFHSLSRCFGLDFPSDVRAIAWCQWSGRGSTSRDLLAHDVMAVFAQPYSRLMMIATIASCYQKSIYFAGSYGFSSSVNFSSLHRFLDFFF